MSKAEVLALLDQKVIDINADLAEVRAAVDSIVEGDNAALLAQIAALEAQVLALQSALAVCEDKINQIRLIVA